ncbi:MAG: tetrathionate reductase family octaheme c-type cytochrome [Phycisphaerales bacterium]|nr:tetrathionate reductase family octaheme c-type cytochrome [Phycisphaerales bacterium]
MFQDQHPHRRSFTDHRNHATPARIPLLIVPTLLTLFVSLNMTCEGLIPVTPTSTEKSIHETIFTEFIPEGYASTSDCLKCHSDKGLEILTTGHWLWEGAAANIPGYESETIGKTNLINNFCIAIPSNEGRCTQCHISVGWKDTSFDFSDTSRIDCLVCHDNSGQYKKAATTAGAPEETVDLQMAAISVGAPTRANCGSCHYFAGGGDNVKHGDLSSAMTDATYELDVHMAADGRNWSCQVCHTTVSHEIRGTSEVHSMGGELRCTTCHNSKGIHENSVIDNHTDKVACQACHLPAFARAVATKTEWYWDEAGQDIDPIPMDEFGMPTYDKKKGRSVHAMNVRPELMWYNHTWEKMAIGVNDTYTVEPVVLSTPLGDKDDPDSKLYPFKKMIGRQPADTVNKRMIVPHLFGMAGGANPYWAKFDWDLAMAEGAAYTGVDFSGTVGFVDTVMYLTVNHEIAPPSMALDCNDCHNGGIDFTKLGYSADPAG